MHRARVMEITESQLVMEQQKNRQGVCIIPEKQDAAARAILEMLGRGEPTEISGSKRGTLRYAFAPPLTLEEYDHVHRGFV
jgi:hypothetical protein